MKATIHGRAAHAGVEPEKGISAIMVAAQGIAAMKLGRIDDETTAYLRDSQWRLSRRSRSQPGSPRRRGGSTASGTRSGRMFAGRQISYVCGRRPTSWSQPTCRSSSTSPAVACPVISSTRRSSGSVPVALNGEILDTLDREHVRAVAVGRLLAERPSLLHELRVRYPERVRVDGVTLYLTS
jgi:hypothetical protein